MLPKNSDSVDCSNIMCSFLVISTSFSSIFESFRRFSGFQVFTACEIMASVVTFCTVTYSQSVQQRYRLKTV